AGSPQSNPCRKGGEDRSNLASKAETLFKLSHIDRSVEAIMKKTILFCIAATLAASPAFAVGNTINWGGCLGSGAVSNQNFDCANLGGPYNLVLELQPGLQSG